MPYHGRIAGDPQFGPAPDLGSASGAPVPLEQRDPVALRRAVEAAVAEGRSAGAVYGQLIRPALEPYAVAPGSPVAEARCALARSIAHAALAGLAETHPDGEEGAGRRAAVLEPPDPLGELDARMLADVLEAAGWTVTSVPLGRAARAAVEDVERSQAELVLVPAADSTQVLGAQLACSLVRRLSIPPLVVGVAFDGRPDPGTLPTDAFAGDADALPPLLRRRLGGGGGSVRWGIGLSRTEDELVVSPAGVLDSASACRLRDVVESRRPLYGRILIDLRELLAADAPGLTALVAWDAERPWGPSVAARADERTLSALRDAGLEGALPLV